MPLIVAGGGVAEATATGPHGEVYDAPFVQLVVPHTSDRLAAQPAGIAKGPDGAMWFTDYVAGAVERITAGGSVTQFPLTNTMSSPTEITAGPDGALWFGGHNAAGIGRITTAGAVISFSADYNSAEPGGITAGQDGDIWFTDGVGGIDKMTPTGQVTTYRLPASAVSPNHLAAGADGRIWLTAIDQVGAVTTDGTVTMYNLNDGYRAPGGITGTAGGDVWFTKSGKSGGAIGRITAGGRITDYDIPQLTYEDNTTWPVAPVQIAAGSDGSIWFSHANTSAVGRLEDGTMTEYLPPGASSFGGMTVEGIAVGPDGRLWFTNQAGGKVGYLDVGGSTPTGGATAGPSGAPATLCGATPTGTTPLVGRPPCW